MRRWMSLACLLGGWTDNDNKYKRNKVPRVSSYLYGFQLVENKKFRFDMRVKVNRRTG